MTVGPGITPGLLTLSPITAQAVIVAKRSRAMRIARNYRRWGVAPRPENVVPPDCLAAQRF
jgi:threonine aldolase